MRAFPPTTFSHCFPYFSKTTTAISALGVIGVVGTIEEKYYQVPEKCPFKEAIGPLSLDFKYFQFIMSGIVLLFAIVSLLFWCNGKLESAGADFCVEATFNTVIGSGCLVGLAYSVFTCYSYGICDSFQIHVKYTVIAALWLVEIGMYLGTWMWYFKIRSRVPGPVLVFR